MKITAFLILLLFVKNSLAFSIISTAFGPGKNIPELHTCQGEDISPRLMWEGAPKNTKSFVLIVEDPDAPDPRNPKMTWVHWVVYDIPANLTGFPEKVILVKDGIQGTNDFKKTNYGGPCPPIGKHRYFFKLFALDKKLNLEGGKTKKEVRKAMEGHIIEKAELIGKYRKK